jgi:uncharacterized membrane protein (UPF0127 family)
VVALIAFLLIDRDEDPFMIGKQKVVIAGETFGLELADTPEAREQGLMFRTVIPKRGGMLFVFPDYLVRVQGFWMKNCPIDMDIIFLDSMGVVTATHHMNAMIRKPDESEQDYETRCQQHNYSSLMPAQFAIELQSGTVDRLQVKPGNRIALELDRLKQRAR